MTPLSSNPEKAKLYYDLLDSAIYLGAKTFVCGINYDKEISLYKNVRFLSVCKPIGRACEAER